MARTRIITYADPVLSLPATITEPSVWPGHSKVTTFVYGDAAHPHLATAIVVSGFRPDGTSVSQTNATTYTTAGQPASLTDAWGNTTSFTYWTCATGGKCGQLAAVTNALNQATTFDTYDAAGRLTKSTDPNSRVTTRTYDSRGRPLSVTETPPVGQGTARSWGLTYDANGRIATVTRPDGLVLSYAYDVDGKETAVTDSLGNRSESGYDLRGNRTSTSIKNSAGATFRQSTWGYDARSHIASTDHAGSVTHTLFDAVGNLTSSSDPNSHTTTWQIDARDRIVQATDPLNGVTSAAYDAQDRTTAVASPNGAGWAFTYDDLGNALSEISPDRGAVLRSFDAAGNGLTRTDARGVAVSTAYDALNRPMAVTGAGDNISYSYDTCANGKGRLCAVADGTGTWSYTYDGFGRRATQTWVTAGQTFVTHYTWTPEDRLASITYPSGRQVVYTRDAGGRIVSITTGGQTVVGGRTYRPDGLLASQTYGNGLLDSRNYSLQGWLTDWTTGAIDSRWYSRDPAGNITAINANLYVYDPLDRLTVDPTQVIDYDANGNRITDGSGGYAYASDSNRLTAVPAGPVTLDASGNTTAIGNRSFTYNLARRLATASVNGVLVGSYSYAFDGQRSSKTTGGATTLFHYNTNGELIAETDGAGTTLREYVRDDEGRPLAMIAGGTVTYLHPDHLGTPRFATNTATTITWRWDDQSFGASQPMGYPTINLRYPGQYYDQESGLHQNYFRDYDPATGRYVESDPIGLGGGVNTYAYVGGNPLSYYDPYGLFGMDDVWGIIYDGSGGWSPSQGFVDFSAGLGDELLLGQGQRLRRLAGVSGGINKCSATYRGGQWTRVAALAALGGIGGARGLPAGAKLLSNSMKGQIGESTSLANNWLKGSSLIGRQVGIDGLTTIADSAWLSRNGAMYYVESKFGTAGLTRAQRIAQRVLGDMYRVERWTYGWVGKVGAVAGAITGAAVGSAAMDDCTCQ